MKKLPLFLSASLILTSLLLTACQQQPQLHSRKFIAFGTLVEIKIYSTDKSRADRAMNDVERDFRYMTATWDPWRRNAMTRVNNLLQTTEWFSVAPSVYPLIKKAIPIARKSEHLFNPAIGKMIKLWEFNKDERSVPAPPDAAAVRKLVNQNPTLDDIETRGITIRSRNPAIHLDFGAFAKGYGIDATLVTLQKHGIKNALIAAGGDLRVIGSPPRRQWHIAIKHPRKRGYMASVKLKPGESIFTSGDYERYFMDGVTRYHHIIDPRTGYPAKGTISVTVIHHDAAEADAAATALFVAGPKDWHRIAKKMGIKYVMLIDTDNRIHMNPAMAKRIRFRAGMKPRILRSKPL